MSAPAREAPRALIVEHDEAIRQTLTLALESLGFAVVTVSSGDAALEAMEEQLFAVAIIESRLPGVLSGNETLEALELKLPSLPTILLGEPERPADLLAAFHAGASDVLFKPFELTDLRASLARALVKRSDENALDFHGRVELAKTALASGAFDVAAQHLRGALGQNPLDAEVLNLYGVARELGNDVSTATQAYRAAFACDPSYHRARENLERVSDQFAYIGLFDDARTDYFQAASLHVAVPILDPVRDLMLCRLAKLIGGPSSAVAVGVLFDPPTEDTGAAKTIARRRGFVRAVRGLSSVPCVVHYIFAVDRVAAIRRLREDESCDFTLVGEWTPEIVRSGIPAPVFVARAAELPRSDGVLPDLSNPLFLALAVNVALATNMPIFLPEALADAIRVTTLQVHALFSHAKLQRPVWLPSEVYIGVRAPGDDAQAITIGSAADSMIRLL